MKRAIGILLLIAAPVNASTKFQAYEVKDQIIEGEGGTRETVLGVDFWTTGTPPHKYKVIGIIIDDRNKGMLTHDAVGSEKVAKVIKEAGGDAAIVQSQSERTTGVVSSGSASYGYHYGFGTAFASAVRREKSEMIVVKYLPSDPAQK